MRWLMVCLLSLAPAACGDRQVGSADAGGDGSLPLPDLRPSPDLGPATGVWISTDRSYYGMSRAVRGTVHNDSPQRIYLPGCALFSRDQLQGGAWVDRGESMDCFQEGNAVPLEPGQTRSQETHLTQPGSWRLVLGYGVGCEKDTPLSQARCDSKSTVRSPVITAIVDRTTCERLNTLYKQRLEAARKCDDTQVGDKCRELVQGDLACGCALYVDDPSALQAALTRWSALQCHRLFGPCGIRCEKPAPAICVKGVCTSGG